MRLQNIDILRGIVMIIMCIDHARDYTLYHPADPMDLANTPMIVYLLRVLASFCAPTFILLAGLSASLYGKKRTKVELSKYLFSRGLILCLLEFTLVNWAWSFNPLYKLTYLQVIWAIGIAMIVLSALVHLRIKYILFISLLILFGHNLFDHLTLNPNSASFYIWSLLDQKNILPITAHWSVRTTYPVLPVIAIIALGYCLGYCYTSLTAEKRIVWLKSLAITSFILFLLFRLVLNYGDPFSVEWSHSLQQTTMSIFNLTKYPMSLQFVLFTLSATLLFLSLTESLKVRQNNPLLVFGQVPLFFYVFHIYILHTIALLSVIAQGIPVNLIDNLGGIPPNFGQPLWWLIWTVGITLLILLPLCKRYRAFKMTRKHKWTSYF